MADDVTKKIGIELDGKVTIDPKSAKEEGRKGGKELKDGIEEVIKKTDFSGIGKAMGDALKDAQREIDKTKKAFADVGKKGMYDIAKANFRYKQQQFQAKATPNRFTVSQSNFNSAEYKRYAQEVRDAMGAVSSQGQTPKGDGSFQFLNESIDNITEDIGKLKEVFNPVSALAKGTFKAIGDGFKQVANKAKEAIKPATIFFNQIKRIALYRAIRSALKKITQGFQEGVQNAYHWAVETGNQFAKSMDTIATASLYLKNSLGALAMPIINTFAPVIDAVIDKFVDLLNIINQFIATITGASTWTKALKYPTEYAEAVSGASKEIKNQLLGFDELNVLNAPSGSGSGSALDYGAMFQEMELSAKDLNFAEAIKKAIKDSNWGEVGHLLSLKFNSVVEKIESVDLANALGEKINNALTLVHTLLNEMDFYQVGVKIGQFVSNLKLDWGKISESWVRWRTNILDVMIGLINGINWGNVARSLGDAIKGLFNGITKWLNEVDWYKLASDITTAFFDLIGSIDWNGILKGLLSALKAVLTAVWNSISGAFQTLIKLFTGDLSLSDIINGVHHSGASIYNGVHISIGGNEHSSGGGRGFASGGFPQAGTYFYAGEAGPELVAQIGGRTGVMNTDQMADSLASANEGVIEALVSVGNAVVTAINRKDTSVNVNDIRKAINSAGLRYGV